MPAVTLTATNCIESMSKTDPEADFNAWVAFVAARNPDWEVAGAFSERMADDWIDAGDDAAVVRSDIQADWDAFCADASAWPARGEVSL